ncbi:MAG: hypothetical protein APF84_17185 [Gracilibacter sp. BRH_c7a]|nr:MAG: hypothetical protein APF84_17185 [Gracilibacter sp. BRH_c7a]
MKALVDQVKEQNNILDVAEELIGFQPTLVGDCTYDFSPCPICGHQDNFRVDMDKGIASCFSSSSENATGMDIIELVKRLKKVDFIEAVVFLAQRAGIQLPEDIEELIKQEKNRRREQDILTATTDYYHSHLTEEVKKYLSDRGFKEETINRFKIGYAQSPTGLLQHIQVQGYSYDEALTARVINPDNSDYYYGCITFPNWYGNFVTDIQGRTIEPKQYRNRKGTISHLFNEQALSNGNDVFLCEGIPDTLSLIQLGFNAVGIYGVGGFKEEWVKRFENNGLVYIFLDSDEAGKNASKKMAHLIGMKARIIKLNDFKDVNELLQAKDDEAKDIIEQLVKESVSLIELMIEEIPQKSHRDLDLSKPIEKIAELPPTKQDYYIKKISDSFGVPVKDVRDEIRQKKKELSKSSSKEENDTGTIVNKDPFFIRLGLDFLEDKALISQNFLLRKRKKDGLEYMTYEPRVITSDRELLAIPQRRTSDPYELLTFSLDKDRLLAVRHDFSQAKSRWSKTGNPYSVHSFLNNQAPKVDMGQLYDELYKQFKKYYYSEDEDNYVICTLYTIVTYFHQCFNSLGYLHLNGLAGSGKSTLSRVFENLCFNGSLVIEPSDASIFRMAEHFQLTMIIDEKENISNRGANKVFGALMTMLKSRYQKGACVPRMNLDNKAKSEDFAVYGPTIIANVMGLEDILQTRAIPIQTKIVPKDKEKMITGKQPEDNVEFSLLRDKLYCAVMQYFNDIRKLADTDTRGQTSARDNEIFHPLIVMGEFVDRFLNEPHVKNDVEKAIGNKMKLRELNKERSPEEMLKMALLELLTKEEQNKPGGMVKVTVYDIKDYIHVVYGDKQEWVSNEWVGTRLKSIGMIKSNEDRERVRLKHLCGNTGHPHGVPSNIPLDVDRGPDVKIQCYVIRYDRL